MNFELQLHCKLKRRTQSRASARVVLNLDAQTSALFTPDCHHASSVQDCPEHCRTNEKHWRRRNVSILFKYEFHCLTRNLAGLIYCCHSS